MIDVEELRDTASSLAPELALSIITFNTLTK